MIKSSNLSIKLYILPIITGSSFQVVHISRQQPLGQDYLSHSGQVGAAQCQCAIVCQGTGRAPDTSDSELQTLSWAMLRTLLYPGLSRIRDCDQLRQITSVFFGTLHNLLKGLTAGRENILPQLTNLTINLFQNKIFSYKSLYSLISGYLNLVNGVTIDWRGGWCWWLRREWCVVDCDNKIGTLSANHRAALPAPANQTSPPRLSCCLWWGSGTGQSRRLREWRARLFPD